MFVFFFQAEDGIRDYKVTGVQTCALPISDDGIVRRLDDRRELRQSRARLLEGRDIGQREHHAVRRAAGIGRSEERRVGKDWRTRSCTEQTKGKNTINEARTEATRRRTRQV